MKSKLCQCPEEELSRQRSWGGNELAQRIPVWQRQAEQGELSRR